VSQQPFASVIIPVYNNAATLGEVLGALGRQSYPKDRYEVIVVDNMSTDGSRSVAGKFPVKLVHERDRQSSYAARNKGMDEAKGDYFCFLDGDCVADPDWLRGGISAMVEAGADLAGGRIDVVPSGRGALLAHYERLSYFRQEDFIREHGTAAGANLWLSRRAVEAMGPFRDDLESGGDGEICIRGRRNGFSIVYAQGAAVSHRAVGRVITLLKRYHRVGKGEAHIARHQVDPIRAEGSSIWSRKAAYLRRVWAAKEISPIERLGVMALNALASVAQVLGYLEGRRDAPRPPADRSP